MKMEQHEAVMDLVTAIKKFSGHFSSKIDIPAVFIERAILKLTEALASCFHDPEGLDEGEEPTEDSSELSPIFPLSFEKEVEADLWNAIDFIFEYCVYRGKPIDEIEEMVIEKAADFAGHLSLLYASNPSGPEQEIKSPGRLIELEPFLAGKSRRKHEPAEAPQSEERSHN